MMLWTAWFTFAMACCFHATEASLRLVIPPVRLPLLLINPENGDVLQQDLGFSAIYNDSKRDHTLPISGTISCKFSNDAIEDTHETSGHWERKEENRMPNRFDTDSQTDATVQYPMYILCGCPRKFSQSQFTQVTIKLDQLEGVHAVTKILVAFKHTNEQGLNLHLFSGNLILPGYLNLDDADRIPSSVRNLRRPVRRTVDWSWEKTGLGMIPSNSINMIVIRPFMLITHISPNDLLLFFSECWRILCRGGHLYLEELDYNTVNIGEVSSNSNMRTMWELKHVLWFAGFQVWGNDIESKRNILPTSDNGWTTLLPERFDLLSSKPPLAFELVAEKDTTFDGIPHKQKGGFTTEHVNSIICLNVLLVVDSFVTNTISDMLYYKLPECGTCVRVTRFSLAQHNIRPVQLVNGFQTLSALSVEVLSLGYNVILGIGAFGGKVDLFLSYLHVRLDHDFRHIPKVLMIKTNSFLDEQPSTTEQVYAAFAIYGTGETVRDKVLEPKHSNLFRISHGEIEETQVCRVYHVLDDVIGSKLPQSNFTEFQVRNGLQQQFQEKLRPQRSLHHQAQDLHAYQPRCQTLHRFKRNELPPEHRANNWAIGAIITNENVNSGKVEVLKVPILHAGDVDDVAAMYLADPFIVYDELDNIFVCLFEILTVGHKGVIGAATSSDGKQWTYQGVVLEEVYHLSFPYVFFDPKTELWFMLPESHHSNAIKLYSTSSTNFPNGWTVARTLLEGHAFQDSGLEHIGNQWFLFTTIGSYPDEWSLYAFVLKAESLLDLSESFVPHPMNPLVSNSCTHGRLGGRIIQVPGALLRISQVAEPLYGTRLTASAILALDQTIFVEEEDAFTLLCPNKYTATGSTKLVLSLLCEVDISREAWFANRIHQLDVAESIDGSIAVAVFDGANRVDDGIGYRCRDNQSSKVGLLENHINFTLEDNNQLPIFAIHPINMTKTSHRTRTVLDYCYDNRLMLDQCLKLSKTVSEHEQASLPNHRILQSTKLGNRKPLLRPRIGIIHYRPTTQEAQSFEHGFRSAIEILSDQHDVTWINLDDFEGKQPADVIWTFYQFDVLLVKSNWGWTVDEFVRMFLAQLPIPKVLLISGSLDPPEFILSSNIYQGLMFETPWYGEQHLKPSSQGGTGLLYRPDLVIVQGFGVNTDILFPNNIDGVIQDIDYLFVGMLVSYKRPLELLKKSGRRVAIGRADQEESAAIVESLQLGGVEVITKEYSLSELCTLYKRAKVVLMPAALHGGGERVLFESRACGATRVEVSLDNPKLLDLLEHPVMDHRYYARQLDDVISQVLVRNPACGKYPLATSGTLIRSNSRTSSSQISGGIKHKIQRRRRHLRGLYLGWLGNFNIGDELLFETCVKFLGMSDELYNFSQPNHEKATGIQIHLIPHYPSTPNCQLESIPMLHGHFDFVVHGGGSILTRSEYTCILDRARDAAIPILVWGSGWDPQGTMSDGMMKWLQNTEIQQPNEKERQGLTSLWGPVLSARASRTETQFGGVRGPLSTSAYDNLKQIDIQDVEGLPVIGDSGLLAGILFLPSIFHAVQNSTVTLEPNWFLKSNRPSDKIKRMIPDLQQASQRLGWLGEASGLYHGELMLVLEPKQETKLVVVNYGANDPSPGVRHTNTELVLQHFSIFCASLIQSGEYRIVLFAMSGDDVGRVMQLYNSIRNILGTGVHQQNLAAYDRLLSLPEMLLLLRGSFASVSYKLHANILSCAVGIPFVQIAYHFKSYDFGESVGLSEYIVGSEEVQKSASALYDMFKKVIQQRRIIQHRCMRAVDEVLGRYRSAVLEFIDYFR